MQAIQPPGSLNLCPHQLIHPYASSSGDFKDFAGHVNDDFSQKLRLHDETPAPIGQQTPENLGLIENSLGSEKAAVVEDDDDDDEDDDFSFAPNSPDSSPVSADELFRDGRIRPVFPLFGGDLLLPSAASADEDQRPPTSLRPPLKKLFSERRDSTENADAGEGSGKAVAVAEVVEESSPTVCKKCNSTGFSKLWRFRDIVRRSSSDGKDAFVFLNHSTTATAKANNKSDEKKKMTKIQKMETLEPLSEKKRTVKAKAGTGTKTASSMSVRTPKRRSYLPYRLGFFTNVDGMTRNVHPF